MSDKIQKKLDQETFNPVFTVFLLLLLRISGLFDGFEDSEPEIDRIPAMDRAVGTDLSSAVAQAFGVPFEPSKGPTLGERQFTELMRQRRAELERMANEREARGEARWTIGNHDGCHLPTVSAFNPRRPNDLRRFEELSYEPIHEQADEVHIDLGALGTVAIPVPEGARSLEVDPRTFTIQWTMQDYSVRPVHDLRDYMTSLPRRQMGGFFDRMGVMDGYCTPSRHPMTGRSDPRAHYSVGPDGRYVYNAGAGPESRHVGPVVVGRRNDGRLVLMGPDGTPYTDGEDGCGPSLETG